MMKSPAHVTNKTKEAMGIPKDRHITMADLMTATATKKPKATPKKKAAADDDGDEY